MALCAYWSDFIAEDDKVPDWINAALDEIPNDGNSTYEWVFKQMGLEESTREVLTPVDRSTKDPRNSNSLKINEQESEA